MKTDNNKEHVGESDHEDPITEPSNKKKHSTRTTLDIWEDICKKIDCSPTDFLALRPKEFTFRKHLKLLDTGEQKRLLDYLFDEFAVGYERSFFMDIEIVKEHYRQAINIIKSLQIHLPQTDFIVLKWKGENRHMLPLLIYALVKANYIEGTREKALAAFQQIFSEENIAGASGRSAVSSAASTQYDETYENKIDEFTNKLNEAMYKIRKDRRTKKDKR